MYKKKTSCKVWDMCRECDLQGNWEAGKDLQTQDWGKAAEKD